jgi:Leucine-rich repeat (LRR) protein
MCEEEEEKKEANLYQFYVKYSFRFTHLTELNFCKQKLTSLPSHLPPSLAVLYCHKNRLTSLPSSLPDTLERLDCSHNLLTFLPSKLPTNLTRLIGAHNLLRVLDTTTLPRRLKLLDCAHNQLQHITLDAAPLPPALHFLYLSHNQLSSLWPLPPFLQDLECAHNRLTTLGPTLPSAGLKYLWCNDNLLQSLPLLPDTLQNINSTRNSPALPRPLQLHGCVLDKIGSLNQHIYVQMSKQRMQHNDFRWYLLFHSANFIMHPRHLQPYLDANILAFDDDSFAHLTM